MILIDKAKSNGRPPVPKGIAPTPATPMARAWPKPGLSKLVKGIGGITRRPPALRFSTDITPTTQSQGFLENVSGRLAQYSNDELAYKISELALRHQARDTSDQDPDIRDALGQLLVTMRMFEHLSILKTEQDS